MKKIFALIFAVCFVFAGSAAMACDGPGCNDQMVGSGNFDIDVFAIGGGADADLRFDCGVPGITGGLAVAGGVGAGEGSGFVQTTNVWTWVGPKWYNWGWRPLALGTSKGYVGVTAGGLANTYAIPGGTASEAIGQAGVFGGVEVVGLAGAEVCAGAIAGEATVDFSTGFKHGGFTGGLAGQGAVGGLVGGAAAFGLGSADFEGDIFMYGNSYSASWSKLSESGPYVTKALGTNVGASTEVISSKTMSDCGLATAFVDGGYIAAGLAKTCTVQLAPGGLAKASAIGVYEGCGPLGTNFYGSANGYSVTSVTTIPGWNGSINSAASGMTVQVGTTSPAN